MDGEDILLICAGGVFVLLFLAFIITALRASKIKKESDEAIKRSYMGDNLRKMEYDLAMYDEDKHRPAKNGDSQMTIEEVLANQAKNPEADSSAGSDDALFKKVENEGVEEITGDFK
jgi:hypothetical protein